MPAPKLTPAQFDLLQIADEGRLFRQVSTRHRAGFAWRIDGRPGNETRRVEDLVDRGLLYVDEVTSPRAMAVLTASGRALLATLDTETEGN